MFSDFRIISQDEDSPLVDEEIVIHEETGTEDEFVVSGSVLNAVIQSLEKNARMLRGVLKRKQGASDSVRKTRSKKMVPMVAIKTVYNTSDGKKPNRAPVTLTFLRGASVSELYFKGVWIPEYDVDDSFKPAVFPDRGRKFRSEVRDYIDGYDIDDVTFGNEDGDVAKPLKVLFATHICSHFCNLHLFSFFASPQTTASGTLSTGAPRAEPSF